MTDLSQMSDIELLKAAGADTGTVVSAAAQAYGVPEDLVHAGIRQESGGDQGAVSPKGASGRMQLMPGTAKDLGVNPNDPVENIYGGVQYLKQQYDKFGDWDKALWAYNAGPKRVEQGIMPKETKGYIASIKNMLSPSEAQAAEIPKGAPALSGMSDADLAKAAGVDLSSASNEDLMKAAGINPTNPQDAAIKPVSEMSDAELLNMMQNHPALKDDSRIPFYLRNPEWQAMIEKMSGPEKLMVGIGAGLENAWQGAKQAVSALGEYGTKSLPEGTTAKITQEGTEEQKLMEPLLKQSRAAKAGEIIGGTAPYLAIPGGAEATGTRRMLSAAATGAGIGATSFVPEGESRALNTLAGAGMGAAGAGVLNTANVPINTAFDLVPDTRITQLAKKWGIPLTLSEATTGAASKGETLLERAPGPLGIRSFRAQQRDAAQGAAGDLLSRYIADPAAPDMTGNRAFVSDIYGQLKGLVGQVGNQEIAPDQTRTAALGLLNRYPDIFKRLQDSKTESILKDIVGSTDDVTTKSPILNAQGNPITTTNPKTLTFDEAWELRKGLGDLIGQVRKLQARGEVSDDVYSQFKTLFGAASNDIENWTSQIQRPDIMEKFKAGNEAYKNYVVKYDILQRVFDKTTREVGDDVLFSPAKFSNNLDAIVKKDKYLNVFTQPERDEMAGLANILQVAKRAGQYLENPPTGNRWGPVGALGSVEGAAYLAGGASGATATMAAIPVVALIGKFLTTTDAGKKLALSASKVGPKTVGMNEVMTQIYKQLPRFAAQAAASGNNPFSVEEAGPLADEAGK